MDTAVTRTDDDALAARASAAKVGYLNDPYIKYFVKTVDRKAPVINRGTYVRTVAIDRIIESFLADASASSPKQIVSLGAGSDTRYFGLAEKYIAKDEDIPFTYHELDFPHVCQRKALSISSKAGLSKIIHYKDTPVVNGRAGSILGKHYALHPIDLVDLPQTTLPGLDLSRETLILSEVCLVYMDVAASDAVLAWTRHFSAAVMCIYEPIRGDDAFGRMMVRNLAHRGLELKTLERYPTPDAQRLRLAAAGYEHVRACTMNDVFDGWLDATERERVARLEMFDEIEEWVILADHYCLALGWRGLSSTSALHRYLE